MSPSGAAARPARGAPGAIGARGGLTVVLGAAVWVVLGAGPADAQTAIGTFEGSIPIETFAGAGTATNRIVLEAQEPCSIVMQLDDVFLADDRAWQPVDVGTTPYTLIFRVTPDPAVIRYEGDMVGTRRTFEVTLRADGLDDLPRAGFITYTFVPDSAAVPDGDIGLRTGVAARVRLGAWPADLEGIPARIAVSDLRLTRDRDTIGGLVDRIVPDLPRVVNRGPADVRARTTNVGDVMLQSETTLTLTRVPWFALLPFVDPDGFTVITYIDRPRLLLPGEGRTSVVASTAALQGGEEIDRLPLLGLVRIDVESRGTLGASTDVATASATYLVAPWKEVLLLLVLYRVVRALRRRSGRRTIEQRAQGPVEGRDVEAVASTSSEGWQSGRLHRS